MGPKYGAQIENMPTKYLAFQEKQKKGFERGKRWRNIVGENFLELMKAIDPQVQEILLILYKIEKKKSIPRLIS